MKMALDFHDMKAYSRYLHLKGWCLLKLGQREEGEKWYKKFFHFAYALDGYAAISFETVKKEYEEVFGGKLDLCLEW